MELTQLSISQVQEGLKKKKFSSLEVVDSCLEKIKKTNPKINAFLTVCEKEALVEARKADDLLSRQPPIINRQSLLGIPLAIKEDRKSVV